MVYERRIDIEMENKIKVMHFVSGLVSGGVEQMLCNYCRFMDHNRYEFVVVYQHELRRQDVRQ